MIRLFLFGKQPPLEGMMAAPTAFPRVPLTGGAELGDATGRGDDHPDDAGIGGHAGGGFVSRGGGGSVAGDAAGSHCHHGT